MKPPRKESIRVVLGPRLTLATALATIKDDRSAAITAMRTAIETNLDWDVDELKLAFDEPFRSTSRLVAKRHTYRTSE